MNFKKRKIEEKEQKRKAPEHDMEEDISEIPSNDKLVKAMNKTQGNELDVVYVGSKKKRKKTVPIGEGSIKTAFTRLGLSQDLPQAL